MTWFLIFALATGALAHMPEDGIYPTTESEWWGCCHSDDCQVATVEVAASGENRVVRTSVGTFVVPAHKVHRVNKMDAAEYVCTEDGEPPQKNGNNVRCVFNKVGGW